ncbi:MAG: hypothetical protein ACYDBV_08345 [Nitrospiria bacterium]
MSHILLLYDLNEKDFARDIKDFLEEIKMEFPITMIALSPNKGLTLEEKEKYYFENAIGAIFIITPGSEREGAKFASPSINVEIGLTKKKFEKNSEKVISYIQP